MFGNNIEGGGLLSKTNRDFVLKPPFLNYFYLYQKIDDAFSIYNLDVVVQRLLQWREMLPRIKPFYAVKCNNDPILLKLLADLGCGFDCASRGEIDQIITNGLTNADNIIYANPCKTRKYIQHADKLGRLKRLKY
ncbi:unnamed protein product [Meloidogyne enterolobii]|uniref:Uncharacterized protein n=1 Tax=Meloidogyne enterolobii TaxID=390850 RepID=A0ACB0XXK0_MELEN